MEGRITLIYTTKTVPKYIQIKQGETVKVLPLKQSQIDYGKVTVLK
jgi:hypothetical protein